MFHRLKADAAGGTGMGLALVRRVVERYGGKVRAEQAGRRGTRIVFSWPRTIGDSRGYHAPASDR
jgi:signal transduction histidine kinase